MFVPQKMTRIKHIGPKYKKYVSEYQREKTFRHWPPALKQTPRMMLDAGFFYSGKYDRVICYYCGLKIFGWLEGDDPWTKHNTGSTSCALVQLWKMENYTPQCIPETSTKLEIPPNPTPSHTLMKKETHEINPCKVCLDKKVEILFLPCLHVTVCCNCAPTIKKCIICRREIEDLVKVYIA